jgi:putative tryptophan/tyrosine transport system substrate-binding protein
MSDHVFLGESPVPTNHRERPSFRVIFWTNNQFTPVKTKRYVYTDPRCMGQFTRTVGRGVTGLSQVTALWDPTTGASQVTMTTSAALSLNLKLQVLEVRRREDVAGAVRAARNSQADALNVFSSPFLASLHREIIAFAAEYRLPAIYQWKEHVEAGGLVSYGPNLAAIWRQSAIIVAKVLKGVKPAELPVEQPTKFELVMNLATAKSLDLSIPPSVLLRADEVIE